MKRMGVVLATVALAALGCRTSHPPVHDSEGVSNVTFETAFGDYERVYDTTYAIVNRYSVIKWASYHEGTIVGEVLPTNEMFDKTRRIILARIFDAGPYWEPEIRVNIEVDQSEPAYFHSYHPRFEWHAIDSDQFLETKLNNEVRLALTDNGFLKKHPLLLDPQIEVTEAERHEAERLRRALGADEGESEGEGEHHGGHDSGESSSRPGAGGRATERTGSDTAEVSTPPGGAATYGDLEALGIYYFQGAQYGLATCAFASACDAREDAPFGHFLLAQSRFALGDYTRAADSLRRGVAVNPEWGRSGVDVRGLYGDARQFYRQMMVLEDHVRAHPDDQDARLVLAYVYYMSGQPEASRRTCARILEADASDAEARFLLDLSDVALDEANGLEVH